MNKATIWQSTLRRDQSRTFTNALTRLLETKKAQSLAIEVTKSIHSKINEPTAVIIVLIPGLWASEFWHLPTGTTGMSTIITAVGSFIFECIDFVTSIARD